MSTQQKKGYFTISAISRLLDIHQQTLRIYEKRNLILPTRSAGNTRLYTSEDVDRIKLIQRLTQDFGVNLNGVEIILRLRDQLGKMQEERRHIESIIMELLKVTWSMDQERRASSLVPASLAQLIRGHDEMCDYLDDLMGGPDRPVPEP
ncbi:MerR family transcriptional regulator [bacterium]|nr:MerR family transcriptional regulator [candidate division CSSED10-310 bacterium]